ncbi:ISNCY family transposase [Nostoc sp. 'Peltigera membranacea cyanobiont' 232]|uniref:ISNCY family transposase n=1 Tax=Nostoc sp. 'Peltigera membranacea cyanobiont' 232 TaxID=2014531 RepID=UPI000B95BE8B|nr:ISNCY family transposase [Nostoc sp. 'Peltigera membranacea cyanobiont' 232]OYE00554.1 ISNCY family transposase [Nostoc sp. 'Peltigera membranacea cyanobiont' 232]
MAQKAATIEIPELIQFLRSSLNDLPDERKPGNNTKYQVEDAVMAAFSIFFTQSESFLDHQRLMKNNKGKDNAESLFSIEKIPCDNQIINLLDPVPTATIFIAFKEVYEWLNKNGVLKKFLYLNEEILIALDGTEYFSSKKINCPHCNCRNHRNGATTYFHGCVTPIVVSPNQKQVINLEPEFIKKQDGHQKQDCENAAVKRWLNNNHQNKYGYPVTLLGDDLYSRQPVCELALKQGYNFIFVCLETSHKTLYEWLEFLERNGDVTTVEKKEWDGRKNLIYRYRYTSRLPLRDDDSSLEVNWCEVTVINEKTQKIIYRNNWITNHKISENNVEEIVKAGRSRWKVENEGNNVLKNHGYNLEHNFGHGENHLCELLLSLNLLAFLFHTVLDLVNYTYQKVRKILVTRTTFFKDIRTLLKYLWFPDWSHLFSLIITEHDPLKRINSS